MPLQNRVTPLGELVAVPDRGLVYGNRGCVHDAGGRIVRLYGTRRWIACRLEFKGWHRSPLMQPGKLTELFFLDEATAFAAGHRPCAECRRDDYRRLLALTGATGADELDERLHRERLDGQARRLHELPIGELPDGAFVVHDGDPFLVLGSELLRWTPGGYAERVARPARGNAVVVTPPSLLAVIRDRWNGAVPFLHPSSRSRG